MHFSSPHTCYIACPSQFRDFITRIIFCVECRTLSSSLCSLLHSPVTSSVLGPNSFLSTPFSNTFNLRSSLSVSEQVSYPDKTGKITVWIILIFILLDSKLEGYRQTFRICNTDCFSTTKILIRTRLNIKFYAHHRSCVNFTSVLRKDCQVSTAQ